MSGLHAPLPQWHLKLAAGEERMTYKSDRPNSGVFKINKADHTMGNLLKMSLLEDENVLFAGYRNPHPLEHHIEIRVQTRANTIPNVTPKVALQCAIKGLQMELECLQQSFEHSHCAT